MMRRARKGSVEEQVRARGTADGELKGSELGRARAGGGQAPCKRTAREWLRAREQSGEGRPYSLMSRTAPRAP